MSTAAVTVRDDSFSVLKQLATSPAWLLLIGAILLVYGRTLASLANEWWTNPDYSLGLLISCAVGYLVYEKRKALAAMPLRPSWVGLVLIVISQGINLVGFLGAEFFLQRTSFVLLLAGFILFFAGWRQLQESA